MSSENRIFLQKAIPLLISQAKSTLEKDSLFFQLEQIKIGEPGKGSISVSLDGKTFSSAPKKLESFELGKFNLACDDREAVAFPMETFQKILGESAKLDAFSVDNSSTLVLMVDKNFDEVTSDEGIMSCVYTLLGELCDTESGRITSINSVRLPFCLSGGFTVTAKGTDGIMSIDIYNEDLAHVGSVSGIQLEF